MQFDILDPRGHEKWPRNPHYIRPRAWWPCRKRRSQPTSHQEKTAPACAHLSCLLLSLDSNFQTRMSALSRSVTLGDCRAILIHTALYATACQWTTIMFTYNTIKPIELICTSQYVSLPNIADTEPSMIVMLTYRSEKFIHMMPYLQLC